jgi:hypothetical protein
VFSKKQSGRKSTARKSIAGFRVVLLCRNVKPCQLLISAGLYFAPSNSEEVESLPDCESRREGLKPDQDIKKKGTNWTTQAPFFSTLPLYAIVQTCESLWQEEHIFCTNIDQQLTAACMTTSLFLFHDFVHACWLRLKVNWVTTQVPA